MQCSTFEYINENGQQIQKPKKQYNTLDAAIAVAKIENARPERINKVVAYKCSFCFKYHVGRNGKPIKEKDRQRLQKEATAKVVAKERKLEDGFRNLKVVGFIDLDKIRY
jgi:hypothetical protein